MNKKDILRKEKDKLAKELYALPPSQRQDSDKANVIFEKLESVKLMLGEHIASRHQPTYHGKSSFTKTYK